MIIEWALIYIAKYQTIYKRVLREAKEKDNDKYNAKSVDKPKAMWQIINR
jgi:hypothetical protein